MNICALSTIRIHDPQNQAALDRTVSGIGRLANIRVGHLTLAFPVVLLCPYKKMLKLYLEIGYDVPAHTCSLIRSVPHCIIS